ncbi:hypothetical protein CW362_20295 [Streptomyces populi]|uniref:Uncharacterized protein n=1 Tax=Streptomyces populi TaxID=2058924 RepID=A0A2I0SMV6_9ACTN|nr:hypothetical protein CW362_20295 [Streptomyces populi]
MGGVGGRLVDCQGQTAEFGAQVGGAVQLPEPVAVVMRVSRARDSSSSRTSRRTVVASLQAMVSRPVIRNRPPGARAVSPEMSAGSLTLSRTRSRPVWLASHCSPYSVSELFPSSA